MAGALNVRHGSKMRLAFDAPLGQEPKFNMICTFNKALDESAFLVSIPMVGGKALPLDEKQKFLFQYEEGEETRIVAGYVDDEIREGIRHYWKIRRVSEQRQLIRRADVRMKVTLPIEYMQDTWPLNANGEITRKRRDDGYLQWWSCYLHKPLVRCGRDLRVHASTDRDCIGRRRGT